MTQQAALFPWIDNAPPPAQGETLMQLAKRLEAFQTPDWAIQALMRAEYPQHLKGNTQKGQHYLRVLDPCAGLHAIPTAIRRTCDKTITLRGDIHAWKPCGATRIGDFLSARSNRWVKEWQDNNYTWHCIMNPPFSKGCEFVDRAFELGAKQVCMFHNLSFFSSLTRKAWFESAPLRKVYISAERSTCIRFDLLDNPKRMNDTPIMNAWYVFDRNHDPKKHPTLSRIWKKS